MMSAVHLSAMRLRTTRERQCAFMTDGWARFDIPLSKGIRPHVQSESDKPTGRYGMRRRLREFQLGRYDNLVIILQIRKSYWALLRQPTSDHFLCSPSERKSYFSEDPGCRRWRTRT